MHHTFGEVLVDVGLNELLKCKANLIVFSLAISGALLRQVLHGIGKYLRIGAIGHAQEIEKALRRYAVNIRERLQRQNHRRIL